MTSSHKQFGEIVKTLREISTPNTYSAAIISNVTQEPLLVESLKYVLHEELSINADAYQEDYDALFLSQEVTLNSDWTLLIHDFSECLAATDSREGLKIRDLERINVTISKIRENNNNPILLALPENSFYPLDDNIICDIRKNLTELSKMYNNCYLVDFNNAVMRVGEDKFYDHRKKYAFNLPYSPEGSLAIAQIFCTVIRETLGKFKKCLVLDCDNVLWGGVLEEVGINGIKLDSTFPGNQYLSLQKEIIKLSQSGVILALCSKNNEEDVLDVLRNHPFMAIKEENIAAYRVNWNNKVENIKQISDELKISLNDMVFADDSEFEIQLVRDSLPMVTTIQMPVKKPYKFSTIIKKCGLFKTTNLTGDDILRNKTYQSERKRKKEMEKYFNYEEYLDSLNMDLKSHEVSDFTSSRISQLSYRTNRCNLTCKKITTEEVYSYAEKSNYWARCFELTDKFGDYGYVGAMLVHISEDTINIEGFYLSCRALGRNVEKMMLDHMLENVELQGRKLTYSYSDNGKNKDIELLIREYVNKVNSI